MKNIMDAMGKRFWSVILFAGIACVVGLSSGCTFDAHHNQAHLEAFKKDAHESHKFIDKHFMHFDWEDPHNWYIEE